MPGLRRSEVAALAGLSVEYYARLERGQIAGASAGVLDALARALQLDDTERAHLLRPRPGRRRHPHLGPPAAPYRRARPPRGRACSGRWRRSPTASRSSATRTRTCSPPTPSAARSTRPSSATAAARRTWPGSSSSTPPPATSTPTGTCSPRCASGIMRAEAGRDPHDRGLQDLVGELSTQQRDLPAALGRPQRPHPRRRHQALPPPRRRRADPRLRGARHHRRTRPRAHGLHRRTRLPLRRTAPPARLLGGASRPARPDSSPHRRH